MSELNNMRSTFANINTLLHIAISGHVILNEFEFYFGNQVNEQVRIKTQHRSPVGIVSFHMEDGEWRGTGIPVDLDIIGGAGTHTSLENNLPFCLLRMRDRGRSLVELVTASSSIALRTNVYKRLQAIYSRQYPQAAAVLETSYSPGDWLSFETGYALSHKEPYPPNQAIIYNLKQRFLASYLNVDEARFGLDLNNLALILENILLEMDIKMKPQDARRSIGPGAWLLFFLVYLHEKEHHFPALDNAIAKLGSNHLSLVELYLAHRSSPIKAVRVE